MPAKPSNAILFVCLGNICRSPLAEGVFRAVAAGRGLSEAFVIESAGTGAWHAGAPPDPRSVAVARRHGIDIAHQRARQVTAEDFGRFDLILGMDRSNVDTLVKRAPPAAVQRIHLFLAHAGGPARDIPDPYCGDAEGFETIYRTIREASEALVDRLAARAPSALESGQVSSTT